MTKSEIKDEPKEGGFLGFVLVSRLNKLTVYSFALYEDISWI